MKNLQEIIKLIGQDCYVEKIVSKDIIEKLNIKEVSDINFEYFIKGKVVTSYELVSELLETGKPVFYRDVVIFNEELAKPNNIYFSKYVAERDNKTREMKEFQYGHLFENIKEVYSFPVAKAVITMYNKGLYPYEMALEKLNKYCNNAEFVLNKSQEELQKVG